MRGEISNNDVRDVQNPSAENYKNIKPEGKMTVRDADEFWKGEFEKEADAAGDKVGTEKAVQEYTDDNGVKYREGDRLVPDNEYEVNGYKYMTDEKGRIISAQGKLQICDSDYDRTREDVRKMEGQEYRKDDDMSHLFAHRFGGSDGLENLVPMDYHLNRGDYKKLENTLASAVKEGADVRMKVEPVYEGKSTRPSEFRVTYSIDGEKDVVVFKNGSEVKS